MANEKLTRWRFDEAWGRGAGTAIARYARFEGVIARDDMTQEGARVALETMGRMKRRPDLTVEGFIHVAVQRQLSRYVRRVLAYEDRMLRASTDDGSFEEILERVETNTPESLLLARERQERLVVWRATALEKLRRALTPKGAELEPWWRESVLAVAHDQGVSRAIARKYRVPISKVYQTRRKLRRRLLASGTVRALARELSDIHEGQE